MDLRSLSRRLDRIGATVDPPEGDRPRVVALIPRNGREPTGYPTGSFTTKITPFAAVIHYDPAAPPAAL